MGTPQMTKLFSARAQSAQRFLGLMRTQLSWAAKCLPGVSQKPPWKWQKPLHFEL